MSDVYGQLARELMDSMFLREPPMANHDDMSRGEVGILLYLANVRNSALSGELAARLKLTTGRIATALKTLEHKGYIKRVRDCADGRKVTVIATDEGIRQAKLREEEVRTFTVSVFRYLGEEDAREYVRIVKRMQAYRDLSDDKM